MNKKEAVKEKSTKPTNKPPESADKQRGIVVTDLLFAAATLGAAFLVAAMNTPKLPPSQGD